MTKYKERAIDKLKRHILALGAMVEESVQLAVEAVGTLDAAQAARVIERDEEIDQMEVDVEEECLKILALYQPVAIDLRFVVAALKINSDLERIGDEAVNIAERALFLARADHVEVGFDFALMSEKTQDMLRRSLDALIELDSHVARAVGAADDEVDALNRRMYLAVQEAMRKHPEAIEELVHLLSISRHLERIADYATNIAEDVLYMTEGEIVRHKAEAFR